MRFRFVRRDCHTCKPLNLWRLVAVQTKLYRKREYPIVNLVVCGN